MEAKKTKRSKKGKKPEILAFLPLLLRFVFFAFPFISIIEADCKNVS
jgi:hypothetical protein